MDSSKRVQEAVNAIKNGEMVIVMDDEDRENEGDLVMAGIFSTPEKVNFMAKYARGLICVSITKEIAKQLDLQPMVSKNDSNHETAFTVSIDAKSAKTGISAYERDLTINLMCNQASKPEDFVRPGHIFPLIAKDGGVLVRTGHTEASVDLCKLAGLKPVSVICEIMKEDGTMATRGDKFLSDFAKEHNLKVLYVSDLIAYRLQTENLLSITKREKSELLGKACEKITLIDHIKREHYVFAFGAPSKPLVRLHTIRTDYELLSDSEKFEFLLRCVKKLQDEGGYLVFINDASSESELMKNFGIGAQILKKLDIREFRLISSSEREYTALHGFDLRLLETIRV
ncbi:bifunctional 3,4-dihydroxy-2-butanone 4-phosphate synthase/GTP cyclohydrolase II [Helicobacter sp. CLO-3]|uniref:bifunctional 3,4-dihydroxy-2-butanone 4-phosphate synthase/GTP cyclohydrolase II n=1 Tax=unclassified Helicobacter TaxID=2593540 RepID=UPI000805E687|nr:MULTISPECIES: bifunctional 3,4-dihydroxy-2-butanone 4-phosphate synthase/GTP cyclohydrolase II [unclassified Helicobacter]OBV30119.1 3,4-dihydroxy-2-butanone-4-phosphate synthase [Helicobacter sp. CLO-3]OHU82105.1 bifunctional 3,4-dihydroxy-2-butanone 4-phosphate synthase/GTP cyclohydrolase II [Helicobacter sp. CLO-3]